MVALVLGVLAGGAVLLWPGPKASSRLRSEAGGPGRVGSPAGGGDEASGAGRGGGVATRWRTWRAGRGSRARAARLEAELQMLDGLAAALEAGLPVPRALALAVTRSRTGTVPAGGPGGSRPSSRTRTARASRDDRATARSTRARPGTAQGGWAELERAAAQGQALAPAWERTARSSGSATLACVARAWKVASVTGAPLAGAIRVAAHTARERRRLQRAVDVATAGARATVTVLTLLPLAGVGLAAVLGVPPTSLYGHPVAQASAGAGAVLVLVGQVWSRRMVAGVLRGAR